MTISSHSLGLSLRLISLVAVIFTAAIQIYAAQPWGDNYAYQSVRDYLGLSVFVIWAISPYLFVYFSSYFQKSSRKPLLFRLIAGALLLVVALYIYINATFIHLDAQGGLVFLFLPLYQWMFLGAQELFVRILVRRAVPND